MRIIWRTPILIVFGLMMSGLCRGLVLSPAPANNPPPTTNLLANGSLDEDNFGRVANWAQTDIDLSRWYLVQDIPPSNEFNVRWVERVDLRAEGRGYGLRSVDGQNCNYFCSTAAIQIVPAQENVSYTVAATARIAEGRNARLYLDFLGRNRMRIDVITKGGYSTDWLRQSITALAPPGTFYIRVILYTDNAAQGVVYWDDAELTY